MKRLPHFIFFCAAVFQMAAQVAFVPNQGQWQGDFAYQAKLKYGALFFEEDGLKMHLIRASELNNSIGENAHNHGAAYPTTTQHHALKQQWIGSQKPEIIGVNEKEFYYNYFIGNNPNHWRSEVPVYAELTYQNLYDGIDINYSQFHENLKYNWVVSPHADPSQILWKYDGADSAWIKNNTIIIETSAGYFTERIPEVYSIKNGAKTPVDATFKKSLAGFTFSISSYNKNDTLVIDPVIEFASFSGSLADNWGYTATYDDMGNLYAGGIVMKAGYPVSTGAFQSNHANPTASAIGSPLGVDCAISKFNANGNSLLYSTYLGGNQQDQPHSLYVDAQGSLFILGVTSSTNFPTSVAAYQDTFAGGNSKVVNSVGFNNGTDIFIFKMSPNGSSMDASTYVGGSGNDGLNIQNAMNYADESRSEIVVGDDNNIYVSASTLSSDFPLKNASQNSLLGSQDAVIFSMNSSLSNLRWSSYFGGTGNDAGFGVKVSSNGIAFMCGSTTSNDLQATSGKLNPNYMGGSHDGFVASFNQNTGALNGVTYLGTSTYDQAFLVDVDKFNNPYIFGQTLGSYPVISAAYANINGKQFVHKLNPDLDQTGFSTTIGKGNSTVDLVPTALNVDDCLNVLLSGWGGQTNSSNLGGNVNNLPLSADAVQSTTDGSDFYFMVLAVNSSALKFASYFGGPQSAEHVDGGTSRFDKHGNIYQAVCAGCGSNSDFPTTPGAVSNANGSGNCNLGVVKINFDTNIEAIAGVDSLAGIDTSCYSFTFQVFNNSLNANKFTWDFGNGQTDTTKNPVVTYNSLGTYTITLIAEDTICDISDTTTFEVNHNTAKLPIADFTAKYVPCDLERTVNVQNNSKNSNFYEWDWGDGLTSTGVSPSHNYAADGVYTITLIATDSTCGESDTAQFIVDFNFTAAVPEVIILPDDCFYGGFNVSYRNDSAWYLYEWDFDGTIEKSKFPSHRYRSSGVQNFSLTITDTLCNITYTYDFSEDIVYIDERVFIPNAFTPNGDNVNEEFIITGNECLTNTEFAIYDRWGNMVFKTKKPFSNFWNGFYEEELVKEDVYIYRFKCDDFEKRGMVTVFY